MRGGRGRREDRERGRGGGTQSECSNSERGKVTRRQPAKGKERQGNEPKHWLVKYQLPGAGDDDEGGQTLNKINIFSASECQIHVYWFDRCAGFVFVLILWSSSKNAQLKLPASLSSHGNGRAL